MLHAGALTLALLISVPSFANTSLDQQREQVATLKELSKKIPNINIEGYERELRYEAQGLSQKERAQNEVNLLAEQIRVQVLKSYEVAVSETNDAEAAAEKVRASFKKDLELADPSMREELNMLSEMALEAAQSGSVSTPVELNKLESVMLDTVKERAQVLNSQSEKPKSDIERQNAVFNDKHQDYANREEFVAALANENELSSRWVSTTNTTFDSKIIRKRETEVTVQLGFEFMGVKVSAGPKFRFRREYTTRARVMAEGQKSVFFPDGNIDFWKRDEKGNLLIKNGQKQKRFIAFSCEVELRYETEEIWEGGFKVAVVGVGQEETRIYNEQTEKNSRRILVPEYIGDKTVTLQFLREICHNDYLKAKVDEKHTVDDAINMEIKNVLSSVTLSHPKTKCVTDLHCYNWFNNQLGVFRVANYPRCVPEREGFMACSNKGLEGQKCSLFKNGKRISDGMFEFTCDKGLKCVQQNQGGWFKNGKMYDAPVGKCTPINPETYVDPRPVYVQLKR